MKFVLDNSVTMRWLFEDGSAKDLVYAARVLDVLKVSTAIVPSTWGLEVVNVIARSESKGLVTTEQSEGFFKLLQGADIEVDEETFSRSFSDILQIARAVQVIRVRCILS